VKDAHKRGLGGWKVANGRCQVGERVASGKRQAASAKGQVAVGKDEGVRAHASAGTLLNNGEQGAHQPKAEGLIRVSAQSRTRVSTIGYEIHKVWKTKQKTET
jgi:hypothetical protein